MIRQAARTVSFLRLEKALAVSYTAMVLKQRTYMNLGQMFSELLKKKREEEYKRFEQVCDGVKSKVVDQIAGRLEWSNIVIPVTLVNNDILWEDFQKWLGHIGVMGQIDIKSECVLVLQPLY